MADIVNIREGDKLRKERRGEPTGSKTALVLTGGGFTGGVYQIGALRALDLLGVGHSVNDFDIFVGTSCGAFIASLISNGCRPEDLMLMLDGEDVAGYEPLEVDRLLSPNWRDIASRGVRLPMAAAGIARDIALNWRRLSLPDILTMFADLAPGGFYSLEGMEDMLEQQLGRDEYSNDFRQLAKELYIVATDLDTCEPVVFGEAGWDDVPISRATAASGALPLIYRSVKIRGREFVDGGLRSFANIDTAIQHGAKLVVIVNPIVPLYNDRLLPNDRKRPPRISDQGLVSVGSQMFRSLVWSAMHESLNHLKEVHPDVDFILVEPRRDDDLMFSTQLMNVSQRVQIARHGFESVTNQLSSDFDHYREVCAKHGLNISRRRVIETMESTRSAPSSTTRWRRILERSSKSG